MNNYSLSLSRSPTQDSNVLETFEANKHLLESKTTPLNSDKAQRKTSQNLFEIYEDKDLGNAGDFRSSDCIELLKQSDIVVTNPPFSLFREYVAQLVEYDKKFVIVAHQNATKYKEIFPLIRNAKLWLGSSLSYIAFKVPKYYEERSNRFWIDDEGQKWRSFGNICWLTNLDHKKRHEILETIHSYAKTPEKYPKYDNYDAINVDFVNEIPMDYEGVMGVPITFLDKHNPKQFKIIYHLGNGVVNGVKKYSRIIIQKRKDNK